MKIEDILAVIADELIDISKQLTRIANALEANQQVSVSIDDVAEPILRRANL